ncbi:hypothetical protein HAX54_048703 [Datura stramonium]|uniref:PH domain-containing protein n=1 Tax=Datura stramonium TaxID=4076 RepID=A0ABS8SU30_DATST|nr:hypothetical protein [Datura stramonium]
MQYCPNDSSKVMVIADSKLEYFVDPTSSANSKELKIWIANVLHHSHRMGNTFSRSLRIQMFISGTIVVRMGELATQRKYGHLRVSFPEMHQLPYLGVALKPIQGHYQEVF